MNETKDSEERRDPHAAEDKASRETLIIGRQAYLDGTAPMAVSDIWVDGERFVRAADPASSEAVIRDFLRRLGEALHNVETVPAPIGGQTVEDARETTERSGAAFTVTPDGEYWGFEAVVYDGGGGEPSGYIAKRPVRADDGRASVDSPYDVAEGDGVDRLLEVLGLRSFVA